MSPTRTTRGPGTFTASRAAQLDLTDVSAPVVETCAALSLSLFEADVDAGERLFGFLLDLLPDRRSVFADVLHPLVTRLAAKRGQSLEGDWNVFVTSCEELLSRLRRPAPARSRDAVVLYSPRDGLGSLTTQMTALLLDDVQVPAQLLIGCDEAAVREHAVHSRASVASIFVDSGGDLTAAALLIPPLRAMGVSVVLTGDDMPPDATVVKELGATASARGVGETADKLLMLRGPLTAAEAEVLRLAADGYTNGRIAHELGISVSAVKARLESGYLRLGAVDRAHAVAVALRERWIL